MKKTETLIELSPDLYHRLTILADAEQVAIATLLERMVAAYRAPRPVPGKPLPMGTILGEAVPHEEIHVWDRTLDDAFPSYMGDYAD